MSSGWVAPPEVPAAPPRPIAKWLAHASWGCTLLGYTTGVALKGHKSLALAGFIALMAVVGFICAVTALVLRKGQSGVLVPALIGLGLSGCQVLGLLLLILGVAGLGMAG